MHLNFSAKQKNGFTLIELILSIAAIGIIGGFATVVSLPLIIKNDLDLSAEAVIQAARSAQIFSQSGASDVSWGIKIAGGALTVFAGSSYDARAQESDDVYELPGNITVTGVDEVVFAKLTGDPDAAGDITLQAGDKVEVLTINSKGIVDYK